MLAGSIANNKLVNSAITINGNSTSLGGSVNVGTVTSVAATAGTGISVSGSPITGSGTLSITNTAPDQTVVLTAGTGISTSGTYPNFTITNTSPSLGGDVVGAASSTDNAVTRFNGTTGKLIQNSAVIIDDTNNVTGVNSLTATTLVVNDNATLGSSNTDSLAVNARITTDLDPETNNARDIGTSGRNWRDGFFGRNLQTVNFSSTGSTTLGDATADLITANGRFNTDLVPSTDNARDLGTSALKWKQVYATTFTENGSPVVVQTDIGTAPNEIPLNQYLGSMAYQDRTAVNIGGGVATLGTATITSIQNDTEISNVEPSLMLNFAAVEALDPRITYSRASTATYYNGVTTAVAEQNLFLQSQDFTTTWIAAAATVTANSTTAPDGTTTAESFIPTATSGAHSVLQSAGTIGVQCTFSVFAKVNGYTNIQLFGDSSGNFNATFDLTAGTAASTGGAVVSIVNVGSGWYRCIATFTQASSTRLNISGFPTGATASNFGNTFTGDGTSGVFLWGAQLEQRSAVTAYTVTTTQPITNYIPVLLTAASGVPRFDHNPISQESLGFLVEEQRTNLLLQSQTFNTTWTTSAASLIASANIAPDGTQTAFALIPTTSSAAHYVSQVGTPVAVTHTISCYAKYNGYRYFQIIAASSDQQYVNFDLLGGTITASGSAVSASSITSVGNGWYRCSITVATGSSTIARFFIVPAANSVWFASGLTGDGYSGVFIWGAQLEAGAFPTSYIATVASQVTRAADVATMTGTNFSSWYNINEGTVYVDANTVDNTDSRVFVLSGAPNPRLIDLYAIASPNRYVAFVNNSSQTDISDTSAIGAAKIAISYGSTGTVSTQNGSTPRTGITVSTAVIAAQITQLNIGSWNNASQLNGTIKKIAYFPRRLSNAELQEMSS
jgi:hypothetical protein